MKKMLIVAAMVVVVAGAASAATLNPPLLIESPSLMAACTPVPAPCPPAPCPPEPVCPPPAPVCAPEPVCAAPAPQYVTTQKKVWVDEVYTTTEKKTEYVDEVRTRTKTEKIPVVVPVVKHEVKLRTAESCSGSAPRLTRQVRSKVVPVTKMEKHEYTETYTAKVRQTVEVPVVKTRQVKKWMYDTRMVNR